MKIGIMIEGQEGLTWERWFAVAGQVEALGLDSLWRSDHFFSVMGRTERASLEAWVSLTALAQPIGTLGQRTDERQGRAEHLLGIRTEEPAHQLGEARPWRR